MLDGAPSNTTTSAVSEEEEEVVAIVVVVTAAGTIDREERSRAMASGVHEDTLVGCCLILASVSLCNCTQAVCTRQIELDDSCSNVRTAARMFRIGFLCSALMKANTMSLVGKMNLFVQFRKLALLYRHSCHL